MPDTPVRSDAVVIGNGIVGLAIAHALADRGLTVTIVGRTLAGAASWAAPGLLFPSAESEVGASVARLHRSAFAHYAEHLDALAESTGALLSVVRRVRAFDGRTLPPADAGFVNPRAIIGALDHALDESSLVSRIDALASELRIQASQVRVHCADRTWVEAGLGVLATGAWAGAGSIEGAPILPVRPMRGQVALLSAELDAAIVGDGWYAIPRFDQTIIGSTMEDVGFDTRTDTETLEALLERAAVYRPLATARIVDGWAGLRPCSPDLVPLVGWFDGSLLVACGHSRNGILLAFETAEYIADLVTGAPSDERWTVADPHRFG